MTQKNFSYAQPLRSHQLKLPDGRSLGYVDYGDPSGHPVVLFHGLPGSRLQGHPNRSIVMDLGIRLIAIDRPGYGLSDYQKNRTLLDWPVDVKALMEYLAADRFAVLGISGGGPYALACAHELGERLTGVALVSSMGPYADTQILKGMPPLNRSLLTLARWGSWPLKLPALLLVAMARYWPDRYLIIMNAHLPPSDRIIYERPGIQTLIRDDIGEAFRQGSPGAIRDIVLLARPWDFSIQNIAMPIQCWHGKEDTTVPFHIGQALVATLPRCQTFFISDLGHLLIFDRWRDILRELVQPSEWQTEPPCASPVNISPSG